MSKYSFPRYQSPLALLSKLGVIKEGTSLDKNDLTLARKALLAEFDLSQKTTIRWEGREVSRDDVLKLFDAFQSDNLIEYHNAIQQDEVLKRFVGQHQLDPDDPSFEDNPIYETEGFKRFIGPYFGAAFAANVIHLLQNPDFVAAKTLFAFPRLWDEESAQKHWQIIQKVLDEKLAGLKKAKENPFSYGIKIDGRGEKAYFHPDLISILNFLPDSFEQFRTDYGSQLVDLAINLINKRNGETGVYIFNRAKNLKGGFALQLRVSHLEGQLDKIEYQTASSSFPTGRTVWTIVWLIIVLFRIMMNCSG
jgi:hypothetical protein